MSLTVEQVSTSMFAPPSPHVDGVWQRVYWAITSSHPAQPPLSQGYNRLILAEVIRRKWCPDFKVTGLSRQDSRRLKAHGEVAVCLLDLITEVQTIAPEALENRHQAEWFGCLVLEGEALGWAFKGDFTGKGAMGKWRSSQNRKVNALENPFTSNNTKQFFDIALPMAESRNTSVLKAVRRFTKARGALSRPEIDGNTAAYQLKDSGKTVLVKPGRKKVVRETLTG